jgi:hypothetical protein
MMYDSALEDGKHEVFTAVNIKIMIPFSGRGAVLLS